MQNQTAAVAASAKAPIMAATAMVTTAAVENINNGTTSMQTEHLEEIASLKLQLEKKDLQLQKKDEEIKELHEHQLFIETDHQFKIAQKKRRLDDMNEPSVPQLQSTIKQLTEKINQLETRLGIKGSKKNTTPQEQSTENKSRRLNSEHESHLGEDS